jgi:hypothetical protein
MPDITDMSNPTPEEDRAVLLEAVAEHASEMYSLWRADCPVPLRDAHLLLDVKALRQIILSCTIKVRQKSNARSFLRDYRGKYMMPAFPVLLPQMREWVFGELQEGTLIASAIEPDRFITCKRVDIPADRVGPLELDFENCRATIDRKLVAVDMVVRRTHSHSPEMPPAKVSDANAWRWFDTWIRKCASESRVPSQEDDWIAAKNALGSGISRLRVRELRKKHAPTEWRREGAGRPKKESAT